SGRRIPRGASRVRLYAISSLRLKPGFGPFEPAFSENRVVGGQNVAAGGKATVLVGNNQFLRLVAWMHLRCRGRWRLSGCARGFVGRPPSNSTDIQNHYQIPRATFDPG